MVSLPITASATRCRLYIDEVGNGDLSPNEHDPNSRYLSLTGIITRTNDYAPKFTREITALKCRVFGPGGENIILHRREIVRREGVFACLNNPPLAKQFDEGLLGIIRSLPYLASTVTIDKVEHLRMYGEWIRDPYDYCLQAIIERYVLWMNRHHYVGDVVIEGRGKKPDKRVKESFKAIYDAGTEHIKFEIVQRRLTTHEMKFNRKTDNCCAMQLVDMIAHPSFKAMKQQRMDEVAPVNFGSRVIDILDGWKYARHPRTRMMNGWGKKWLPK